MSKRKPLPKTIPSQQPIMDDLLSSPAPQQSVTDDAKKRKEQARGRERAKHQARYDLPPGMKDKITEESIRLGIPASQFAAFLLADALARYEAQKIDPTPYLQPSTSPKYRNNLIVDF